jgi:hypothetical protein
MNPKKSLKALEWLEKEKVKDILETERQKQDIIENIKKLKKEDILPKQPKKMSLWKRIQKVLMG